MKLTTEDKKKSRTLTVRADRILSTKRKSVDPEIQKKYEEILIREGYPISVKMDRSFIEAVVRTGKLAKRHRRSLGKKINPKKKKDKVVKNNRKRISTYRVYIESELWEDRKRRYYQAHTKQCNRCDSYTYIALHHMFYDNKNYGNEPDEHLVPLCGSCHMEFHKTFKTKKDMIDDTIYFIQRYKDPLNTPERKLRNRKGEQVMIQHIL